jgi:hypothetical protein
MASVRPPSSHGTQGDGAPGQHMTEAAGTLVAALVWGIGTFVVFVALGFATHLVVELTVKRDSATWRAAAGAVAAMLLVASLFALAAITGRGFSLLPSRVRARRAIQVQRARARDAAAAGRPRVSDRSSTSDDELDPTMPVPMTPPPHDP